jgi:hypothetical protein
MHSVGLLNEAIKSDLGLGHDVGSRDIGYHPINKSHIGCDFGGQGKIEK